MAVVLWMISGVVAYSQVVTSDASFESTPIDIA